MPGAYFQKTDIPATSTSASYTVRSGVTYEYYVRALNINKKGGQPSSVVTDTIP